jgi:peptidoglycan/xylan/chitin deacetylase (PgdA/CDA1 family)
MFIMKKLGNAESHRITVALTFDFDAESIFLAQFGKEMASRGTYGAREGVPRILKLLKKYGLPATFFIPGFTADRYPDIVRSIVADGHEIGHHTYSHTPASALTPEKEEMEITKGLESLERITGKKPRGYRAASRGLYDITIEMLIKYGFEYDSSQEGADRPYWLEYNDKRTNIVELPMAEQLVDTALFFFNFPPASVTGLKAPSHVEEIWHEDFEGAYEEGGDIYFPLVMHPFVTGRYHRIRMLERQINFMLEHDNVWFARMGEIADYFRKQSH